MDFLYNLLPHLLNGISLGLLFALVALGFMLIVGVMEVLNLAHGSLFALGAYVALLFMLPPGVLPFEFLQPYYALPLGWRLAVGTVAAPLVVGIAGMALELCLRRTYGKDPLYGLLLTFGAALVIEELIRVLWGSAEKPFPVPSAITGGLLIGDLIYSTYRFYASAFASGLAAVAGVIMAPIWGVRPHVGVDAVVPAFIVIVLGGVGSFWGAVLASLLIGVAVGLTGAYASDWSLISMYLLLIAVVTFRARGLLGKKSILER